jgi:hypothetical protein
MITRVYNLRVSNYNFWKYTSLSWVQFYNGFDMLEVFDVFKNFRFFVQWVFFDFGVEAAICFTDVSTFTSRTGEFATSHLGSFHYAPRWRKDPGPGWSRVSQILGDN